MIIDPKLKANQSIPRECLGGVGHSDFIGINCAQPVPERGGAGVELSVTWGFGGFLLPFWPLKKEGPVEDSGSSERQAT